jgi:hypothetical protein
MVGLSDGFAFGCERAPNNDPGVTTFSPFVFLIFSHPDHGSRSAPLRTGLAVISTRATNPQLPIAKSIRAAEVAVNSWYQQEKLAA